jgi:hypothetical protein
MLIIKANHFLFPVIIFFGLSACKSGTSDILSGSIVVKKKDKALHVEAKIPAIVKLIEVRVVSDRNFPISKRTDISIHVF